MYRVQVKGVAPLDVFPLFTPSAQVIWLIPDVITHELAICGLKEHSPVPSILHRVAVVGTALKIKSASARVCAVVPSALTN